MITTSVDDYKPFDDDRSSSKASDRPSMWVKDFAAHYDFCIVFPAENGTFTHRGTQYLENLQKLGFDMFAYRSPGNNDEIYLLLKVPLEKLRATADTLDFVMLLDSAQVEKQLTLGDPDNGIKSVRIAHVPEVTKYHPYQHIYGKYSRQISEDLYWKDDGTSHPFRELVRLKLSSILLEQRIGGKENLKIRRYIRNGWLLGCFSLHNREQTQVIEFKWQLFPFQNHNLPLDDVKEYFGEKIGLFFVFLEYYTYALVMPAVIGIPLQAAVFILNDYSAPFLPIFSVFIALWAVVMLEFWKRREKTKALEWGTIGFEENEVDRPDFKGTNIDSFIDGSQVNYYPSKKRAFFIYISVFSITALILLVIGVVVSIYIIRYAVSDSIGDGNAQTLASILNSTQIQVANFIYSFIATELSELENHRTNTEFEDSLIVKIFVFQFVNSFASFFYLAFVAESMGDCPTGGCMSVLAINLAIIFGVRLVSGNITKFFLPLLFYKYRLQRSLSKHGDNRSRPETELLLDVYDPISAVLEDYAAIAINFGFTAMFVTALPMAAACALVSSVVEIRFDGWKLLNLYQRPFPKSGEDIGTWQTIFLTIAIIAVITNAGITVFTMDVWDDYSTIFRYWVFILFQWVCFTLQMIIMAAIPDIPEEIGIQIQRAEFIERKLIDKVADDNDEDGYAGTGEISLQEYPMEGNFYAENPLMMDKTK